jgi:hypothetical protein
MKLFDYSENPICICSILQSAEYLKGRKKSVKKEKENKSTDVASMIYQIHQCEKHGYVRQAMALRKKIYGSK